ncbi:lipopolysaccharide transport periplasmic protein LptA [Pseudomarimonas arenosa]|uniref:Lipopolysaccharide transport periplasmic protein LptA n=1 Tax=Pseudomarimonas arenosa TaxID=2774145 RepID=A0AAW3ZN55_9GAMM|nr:lipopolysaccharide transport periplasmic protein LptA [Pseudomarimonas arenosa]MBD8527168.1 lipopolysaccharide transport periplasmic protein LptA [Pseudomarimonas arenosa]
MNRLLASALCLLLPLPAMALKSDREKEMSLDAGHGDIVLSDNGRALLSEGVKIEQGSLRIESRDAEIISQAGEIKQAILTGSPATVRQDLDTGGQMQARANRIDYDLASNVLLLTGSVVITQPEGELRGERVRYEIDTGQMEGGAPGSRIQMTIKPKQKAPTN